MYVKMKTPGRNDGEEFGVGDVIQVDDRTGAAFIERGLAEEAEAPKQPPRRRTSKEE